MFGFLRFAAGRQKWELMQQKVNAVLEELAAVSRREVIYVKTAAPDCMDVRQSTVGGLPYIPADSGFLEQAVRGNLYLLAQINLSELPDNTLLKHRRGILQFWIDKESFGTDAAKVIFYPDIGECLSAEEVLRQYRPEIEDISGSWVLSFRLGHEMINTSTYRFEEWFDDIWRQKYGEVYRQSDRRLIADCQSAWFAERNEAEDCGGHKIGGYPDYIQEDTAPADKDVLLLQIGEDRKDGQWAVCIGDCGAAYFHIAAEDLAQSDFSRIFYDVQCY